jgi:DNA-binding Xre family transcriptional regulator
MPSIDVEDLRAQLARKRISHTELARAAGMNRVLVSHILVGRVHAGALSRERLAAGLAKLGLAESGAARV